VKRVNSKVSKRAKRSKVRTYFFVAEVRPSVDATHLRQIDAAWVNAWILHETMGEAEELARRKVWEAGWCVGPMIDAEAVSSADFASTDKQQYFEQVQLDGDVLVFYHTTKRRQRRVKKSPR